MPELDQSGLSEQDVLLQRFVDGDLELDERQAFEAQIAREPELALRVARARALHELLASASLQVAQDLDSEQLFSRISAELEPVANGVRSTAGAGGPIARLLARLIGRGMWIPAGGAFAMLGALLLTVYQPVENTTLHGGGIDHPTHGREPSVQVPAGEREKAAKAAGLSSPVSAIVPRDAVSPVVGAEVVQVEFGDHVGTVFDIALESGTTTAVVWIND